MPPASNAGEGEAPAEPVRPLVDGRDHLELHLRRLGACLERHRYTVDPTLADAEGRRFAASRRLAELDAELADRLAVSEPSLLPLAQLQRRFRLPDLAVRFLVAAAAPGLDLALGRTLAELSAERVRQCDVGFLLELLAEDRDEQQLLLSTLSEAAPLVRYRLVRLGAPRGWTPEGPMLLAPVAVPERILAWMLAARRASTATASSARRAW